MGIFVSGLMKLRPENLYLNNHLEGEVPSNGVFMSASAISIKGNDELCEGIPNFQLPKCKNKKSKKRKLTLTLMLILFGLIGANLVVSFQFFCSLRKRRERKYLK